MPAARDIPPAQPEEYDPRYLAGIDLFNRGEYFEAHEVWEDLWRDCPATEHRFYQALIQAAVAVYHFSRGNSAGATRLFHSGRRYMAAYRPKHHGLDVDRFWCDVHAHLVTALENGHTAPGPRPVLILNPVSTGTP